MIQAATGITLTRRKIGEADVIGRFLLEDGLLVEVKAHGIRKSKSRSNLLFEPGSLVRLTYYANERDAALPASLKEGHVVDRYGEIKDAGYDGLVAVSQILETIAFAARTGEGEASEETAMVYTLLKGALDELRGFDFTQDRRRLVMLLLFVKVRALKVMGLLGDPRSCAECGRALGDDVFWHRPELYFTCDLCAVDANEDDGRWARLIAGAAGARFAKFVEHLGDAKVEALRALDEILVRCIEHFQGAPLKSVR